MMSNQTKPDLPEGYQWLLVRDYWTAACNWQDVSNDEDVFTELMDGLTPYTIGGRNMTYVEATDKAIKNVGWLIGPHHRALIKVYLARRSTVACRLKEVVQKNLWVPNRELRNDVYLESVPKPEPLFLLQAVLH